MLSKANQLMGKTVKWPVQAPPAVGDHPCLYLCLSRCQATLPRARRESRYRRIKSSTCQYQLPSQPRNGGIRPIGGFEKIKRPFRSRRPIFRCVRDDDWLAYAPKMFSPMSVGNTLLLRSIWMRFTYTSSQSAASGSCILALDFADDFLKWSHYRLSGLPERWTRGADGYRHLGQSETRKFVAVPLRKLAAVITVVLPASARRCPDQT